MTEDRESEDGPSEDRPSEERELDDDELLDVLAAAIAETDPVPDHVLEAARLVPEIAGLDAELALLSFDSDRDSDRELAGVRGTGTGRQLTFEAGPLDIEVVVHAETRDGRRVVVMEGQVAPVAAVEVSLTTADPFLAASVTETDDLGRFRFQDVPPGAIRLVIRTGDTHTTARPVVTSWFRS